MRYPNINEIDDYNKQNISQSVLQNTKNNIFSGEDLDEQYNLLFSSVVDINQLKDAKQYKIKPPDLNLDKELAQSKINFQINDENKFLKSRKWDYLDSNKKNSIEKKVELIYKEMNKKQYDILVSHIKRCNLQELYRNFDPRTSIQRIGTLSSLNYLIETTYYSEANNVYMMFEDKTKIESYIYKFRTILGDGDCFYRGIIFTFLENIILTNNILLMKEVLILFDEKINEKNPLIKTKDYLNIINKLNIGIVSQILYYIITKMEKNELDDTYLILLKVFLYCSDFDYGIIYFTRYLIFEYILENEEKIYSKENQIEIGCFLPEDFVEDKGNKNEYYFENFFLLQLMKPKTFAEKLVIYIAPFIFNCKLNILMYEYGANSFIQEKTFISEKDSEFEINLLFRKAHYDIYYKKEYYKKYSGKLDMLPNIAENILYLNAKSPEETFNKRNIDNNQDNGNKNNNQNNQSNKENNKEKNFKYGNYDKIIEEQDKNNKDNLPKCLQCKKSYHHKDNAFGLCNDCLFKELKSQFLTIYFTFLQGNKEEDLMSFFQRQKCSISIQKDISLSQALFNSGYKFDDLFLKIKKEICLYCGFNINFDNYYLELPCNCRICKKECFDGYFKVIEKGLEIGYNEETNNKGFKSLKCLCGFRYDLQAFIYMINKMEEKNLKEQKKTYLEFIKNYFKWKCMICRSNFNNKIKNFCIEFKDENLDKKILKKIDFRHFICVYCASNYEIQKDKQIDCQFCHSLHLITDIKNLNEENETESDCIII